MLFIFSLIAGSLLFANSEAEKSLVAAHVCFAELDRHSIQGQALIPRSKRNIRQIARSGNKTKSEHWTVNDYAVWDSESQKLQYVNIKTNIMPETPAYEVKVLQSKVPPTVTTDKLVLAAGRDGYSCPIYFHKTAGLSTASAKLYQVSVAYEDCSDVYQAVELEAELGEVTTELAQVFEDSVTWRLGTITPSTLQKLIRKRGSRKKLKQAYDIAMKQIQKKCQPVQAANVQKSLKSFYSSIHSSFQKSRLPANQK